MIKENDLEYFIKYTENTKQNKEKKEIFGEVITPFALIEQMFSIIPAADFKNPDLKWLDPGAGTGNFSIYLYFKLLNGLREKIPNIEERKAHIIQNMIYLCEIQPQNVSTLSSIFGNKSNIFCDDFLSLSLSSDFNYIIGNPPFNTNGIKKVPTNALKNKTGDGQTSWPNFIRKSINLLKENIGKLCVFIPVIWMKPDKEGMYNYLTHYRIRGLHSFSNTETNQIFSGNAQTPSCYFLLEKRENIGRVIELYDRECGEYVEYKLRKDIPIPVSKQREMVILSKFLEKSGGKHIQVIKTNMPSKGVSLSTKKTEEYPYENISTCILENNISSKRDIKKGHLIINYSDKSLVFNNQPKLVLAHKMYGLPYLDVEGRYGISNRDNYVIIKDNIAELQRLYTFLSLPIIQDLYKSTQYRMKYLEKYVFELIPDITFLADFPKEITNETIADYFELLL